MANLSMLPGRLAQAQQGSPTSVYTDGTTIVGNGTKDSPLAAVGGTTSDPERVSSPGALSPTNPLSFARATGIGTKDFTLADGTVDGFQKTIAFNPGDVIGVDYYHLIATFPSFLSYDYIQFPSGGGGIVLIWDATNGWWNIISTFLGTPV